MSVPDLETMTRESAMALRNRLMTTRGWPQHESNGWALEPCGGSSPSEPVWLRAMCQRPHAPPRWTLADEVNRFGGWLAKLGWKLERADADHPALFRLVPEPGDAPWPLGAG